MRYSKDTINATLKIMKHFKYFFVFFVLFSVPVYAASDHAIAELTQLLNRFSTFSAQFTQTTMGARGEVIQTSHGTVMIARPGKFRWETNAPTHQIVITNGDTVWVYDVDLAQATKQTVQNSGFNPAKLLSGDTSDLLKSFMITAQSQSQAITFTLIPRDHNAPFRKITMTFKNNLLQSMRIQTNVSQTNEFTFSHVALNPSLSRALFIFHAPSGTEVLK
ncbi:MAG: hypothetical protein ACD_42C00211G0002 [uncultured bacterium]|nr:MAG: hypothetical protein ACD_42C00211G0002 [uncultured bacterium]OGT26642.1 MAG: outer membrane lipoprotein carrier protein LolA [Gammaproteobacteria bacterium RIFCSPHIGHO2_02_FULL_42_43]OGT28337.1 MAG: outer membrane lipoprotein carrier protein LolA [Gammaproteobacteria bacterium RIFCSPHIGHO2_01_FULL_42_8]OGT53052.1 MAG: outer membrane lipoprotein carrier protein LolA [Gammaproteobacteria bacterium RIFCSPHIGHO2_12_FULL_41_25]OGT61174.1 MAG: outer membrane lipoprotein carrier protein LolA [